MPAPRAGGRDGAAELAAEVERAEAAHVRLLEADPKNREEQEAYIRQMEGEGNVPAGKEAVHGRCRRN